MNKDDCETIAYILGVIQLLATIAVVVMECKNNKIKDKGYKRKIVWRSEAHHGCTATSTAFY